MLEILVLGHPQLRLDGAPLTIPSKKSQALLYFLALSDRPHSRSALAGLLWGSKSESDARRNLRVELSKLRHILEPYLTITHTTIGFNHEMPYTLDAALVREAGQNPETEVSKRKEAVDRIRGELLEEFQVQDAQEFEAWLVAEQEDIRRLHHALLRSIVEAERESGEYDEALAFAQRLSESEPWREEYHRQVIWLLGALGRTSAAIAQYERCRMILAEELGVEPAAETQALLSAIKSDRQTAQW